MTSKEINSDISIILQNSRFEKILSLLLDELDSKKEIIRDQPYNWSLTHMISCSQICKILAVSRDIDIEISAIAGAVHDLAIIRTGKFDDHGPLGAPMVREFLHNYNEEFGEEYGLISSEEINIIVQATHNHSFKKDFTNNIFDELIKDADSLDRFLHGKKTYEYYYTRSKSALLDLGIKIEDII